MGVGPIVVMAQVLLAMELRLVMELARERLVSIGVPRHQCIVTEALDAPQIYHLSSL